MFFGHFFCPDQFQFRLFMGGNVSEDQKPVEFMIRVTRHRLDVDIEPCAFCSLFSSAIVSQEKLAMLWLEPTASGIPFNRQLRRKIRDMLSSNLNAHNFQERFTRRIDVDHQTFRIQHNENVIHRRNDCRASKRYHIEHSVAEESPCKQDTTEGESDRSQIQICELGELGVKNPVCYERQDGTCRDNEGMFAIVLRTGERCADIITDPQGDKHVAVYRLHPVPRAKRSFAIWIRTGQQSFCQSKSESKLRIHGKQNDGYERNYQET